MTASASNKRRTIEFAEQLGYVVTPTRKGHWRAVHPCGAIVILASTTDEHHRKREKSRLTTGIKRGVQA